MLQTTVRPWLVKIYYLDRFGHSKIGSGALVRFSYLLLIVVHSVGCSKIQKEHKASRT